MNRSTEQIQLIVVGGVYFFVLMLLICSLQLLIKMARIQMKPRQKYVKPDPLFKSYDAQQNWNWDWVMVFRVYGPDSYVSDYQRHYSLRLIVERLEMGGLQTKLYKSYHYDKIFCKIRCTSDRLKDQAAAVDYPLLMDETEVKMRIERGYRDEFGKYKWYPRRDGWTAGRCKMCQNTRRPWPSGAEDIGTWEGVLTVVSILATISNALMITQTSPALSRMRIQHRLGAFIVLEWILIGAKVVLMAVVDDVPEDVEMQIARQEFIVRKIIMDEPDEELDLEDDLFVDIDEPVVYPSDPSLRGDDAEGGDDEGDHKGEKKESSDD